MSVLDQIREAEDYIKPAVGVRGLLQTVSNKKIANSKYSFFRVNNVVLLKKKLYHVHAQNGEYQFYENFKEGNGYLGSAVIELPIRYPIYLDNGVVLREPEKTIQKKFNSFTKRTNPLTKITKIYQPGSTKPVRLIVYERDGNKCLACGATENLTLDHIIPVSKGGKGDEGNLQTLCKKCNQAKGDRIRDYRVLEFPYFNEPNPVYPNDFPEAEPLVTIAHCVQCG